jgi:hypothetical protein
MQNILLNIMQKSDYIEFSELPDMEKDFISDVIESFSLNAEIYYNNLRVDTLKTQGKQ